MKVIKVKNKDFANELLKRELDKKNHIKQRQAEITEEDYINHQIEEGKIK